MKIVNLSEQNSLINRFIAEMRDVDIHGDSMRFRSNARRLGEIMAYEISKTLDYTEKRVTTPLGTKNMYLPTEEVVVATILRAGLPMQSGLTNYFDKADNAFVSAYRKEGGDSELGFDVHIEYLASPSLEGRTLILADPMLATGSSMMLAYNALLTKGQPATTHFAAIIASQQGVDMLAKHAPEDSTLWITALDEKLNEHAYIVPGLGDAGDLSFGTKMD